MSEIATFEITGAEQRRLAAALGASGVDEEKIDASAIEQSPTARLAVRQLLVELATGTPVHVIAEAAELTTQEAADLLGISRTYVARLIDDGKLAGYKVGSHRRLRAGDVVRYKRQRDARLAGVAAVTEADLEAGVQYH